jgi:class 3 adenylate cyclase
MNTTTQTKCAVMFSDVAGSTQLYEQLGDAEAKRVVGDCLAQLAEVTSKQGGTVIKTIGDELMCRFPTADAAVAAARIMQEIVQSAPESERLRASIRTGLHYGSVIEDEGDVFGDAVNLAARMASVARGGQIITTDTTVAELSPALASVTRPFDVTKVKGKRAEIAIYEVLWDSDEEVTRMATKLMSRGQVQDGNLTVTFADTVHTIQADTGSLSFGRDGQCDVVIDTDLASRRHAHCVVRRGKFVLVDTSTNGTYVQIAGKEDVYLRREELILHSDGIFCLGQKVTEADPSLWVRFSCE